MGQQLLLVEDVEDLGRQGEIVSVKSGYARNYLLPKGVAVIADKQALRRQAKLREDRTKRAIVDRKEAEEQAKVIEGLTLTLEVKVDPEGHMYGSVTSLDLAHHIEEKHKIVIEKRCILLKHSLKEIGVHSVEVRLKEDVTCSFTVKVVPEGFVLEEAPTTEEA